MRRTERNNRFRINGTLITFVDKEPATVEEAAAYRLEAVKLYGENIPEIVIERSVEYADLDIILQPRMPFERIRRISATCRKQGSGTTRKSRITRPSEAHGDN